MMSEIEKRMFDAGALTVERRGDDKAPMMRGHAAVFNQLSEDLGGFREQIVPGAFAEAIDTDDVRALINHDSNFVLGRNRAGTLAMREDVRGLAVEITPPDTAFARDLIVSMERGDVTQMSFAFRIRPNGEDWAKNDDGVWVRSVKRVRLYDVSVVTYPAYTQTDVAMRSLDAFVRTLTPSTDYIVTMQARARQIAIAEAL
jgi:HK97 family phage prohead protease